MYLPDVQPAFAEGREVSRLFVPKRMESFVRNYLHRYLIILYYLFHQI